jgi:hypothetical protein
MFDEVEGVEDRSVGSLPSAQLVEQRQTIGPRYNRLAVDRETLGFDRWAAVAIADNRVVQSMALRL